MPVTNNTPFIQKRSIGRKLTLAILFIAGLFFVEFGGLYFASQTQLKGLTELHDLSRLDDSILQLRTLIGQLRTTVERAGPEIGNPQVRTVVESTASRIESSFSQLNFQSITYPEANQSILTAQKTFKDAAETIDQIFSVPNSSKAQILIFGQYLLETGDTLAKAQLGLSEKSQDVFSSVFEKRFFPLVIGLSLALLSVIVALIIGLRTSRHIIRSLASLTEATQTVALGDFSSRARILAPDEIGRLAHTFNQMTGTLQETTVSRRFVESIIDSMQDSVVVINSLGQITRVNDVSTQTFEYSKEELKGMSVEKLFARPIEMFVVQRDTETMGVTKNGREFPSAVSISLLEGLGVGVRAFVCVIEDITERKEHEETLKNRNKALANVNRELEAFSYSVSHDLRAPLRAIDGFSQAVIEDYSEKLDSEGKENLARIRSAVQRMGKLIDDILNLSRISRAEMKFRKVDLSEIAKQVVQELKSENPKRNINFKIKEQMTGSADPFLMKILYDNLIGNAWKYTSKHENANIEIGSKFEGAQEIFYVKDDGAGFDMTYANKLFRAFQRLHTATEFAGTGVGLATVQRIINRHGGSLWAEGAVERGATFYFTLDSQVPS
jgi:PAS domain S-box-containing protein